MVIGKKLKQIVEERYPISWFESGEEMLLVMEKQEINMSEEEFRASLDKCKIYNPEWVGLVSLVFPLWYMFRIVETGGIIIRTAMFRRIYCWFLTYVYIINIVNLIRFEITRLELILFGLFLVSASWYIRESCKTYNITNLLYNALHDQGKC